MGPGDGGWGRLRSRVTVAEWGVVGWRWGFGCGGDCAGRGGAVCGSIPFFKPWLQWCVDWRCERDEGRAHVGERGQCGKGNCCAKHHLDFKNHTQEAVQELLWWVGLGEVSGERSG